MEYARTLPALPGYLEADGQSTAVLGLFEQKPTMQRLKSRVAIVAGSSRGAGRGIALVLGEEGATVYMTGRSTRGAQTNEA
jgi:5,10-methylene-tetrahydrofolate dehydrogenase/methenyl tetrahydrofolate cyclohydrolase